MNDSDAIPPAAARPQYLLGATGAPTAPKPRVKLVETAGDLTPAGASFTPPTPAPLPERRAGLYLVISLAAAVVSLVFVILLAAKL